MSFTTTKFHEILLSVFRGVALTNCFSSIFLFGEIFKFEKGNSEKKNWIKISCGYAHLHIMSFITTKFHEILLSGFRGVALTRQEAHGPHRSPEKKIQINKHIWLYHNVDQEKKKQIIIFMGNKWFFIWTNLNPLHPRMFCAKFGRNLLRSSGEEDFF